MMHGTMNVKLLYVLYFWPIRLHVYRIYGVIEIPIHFAKHKFCWRWCNAGT